MNAQQTEKIAALALCEKDEMFLFLGDELMKALQEGYMTRQYELRHLRELRFDEFLRQVKGKRKNEIKTDLDNEDNEN
jgi:hypothetical protein